MSFKYSLRQRIGVPGTDSADGTLMIQGIITSRRDTIGREPGYLVEWKDAHGNDAAVWFDESAINAANEPVLGKPRKATRKRKR